MSNYGDAAADKALTQLEKDIRSIYQEAWDDVSEIYQQYISGYDEVVNGKVIHHAGLKERYAQEYAAYQKEAYTKEEFDRWWASQIKRGDRWENLRNEVGSRITTANQKAGELINGTTCPVYAESKNFSSYQMQSKYHVAFSMIDDDAVDQMLKGENHTEFRTVRVDPIRDYAWNKEKIDRALTQGLIQGEGTDKIAARFFTVMQANATAARRNARTAITSAQNAGKMDTYEEAAEMGIEVRKIWVCTLDDRTRESHGNIDGEEVPYDEAFSNGLMYPGDPDGDPSEVYNCRCTMRTKDKVANRQRFRAYKDQNGERHVGNLNYREWKERYGS